MDERQHGEVDDCPGWCVADHTSQVHPDDARHWGDLGTVSVVELVPRTGDSDHVGRSLPIEIGIERAVGSESMYISLTIDERGERSMLITAESALRLSHALTRAAATSNP